MKKSKIILVTIAIVAVVVVALIASLLKRNTTENPITLTEGAAEVTPTISTSNQITYSKTQSQSNQQEEPLKTDIHDDLNREGDIEQEESNPVVMSDYKNWTVIANDIEQNENQSVATGDVGVAHIGGLFAIANEGIITHTNQSGSVDSIYLPGATFIEVTEGLSISSTDTELAQTPEGVPTIRASKFEVNNTSTETSIWTRAE